MRVRSSRRRPSSSAVESRFVAEGVDGRPVGGRIDSLVGECHQRVEPVGLHRLAAAGPPGCLEDLVGDRVEDGVERGPGGEPPGIARALCRFAAACAMLLGAIAAAVYLHPTLAILLLAPATWSLIPSAPSTRRTSAKKSATSWSAVVKA